MGEMEGMGAMGFNLQLSTCNFQRSVRGTFLRRRCLTIKNWPKARGCSRFGPSYERTSSYRVGAPTGGQTPALGESVAGLVAGVARWCFALGSGGGSLSFSAAAGVGAGGRVLHSVSVHDRGVDHRRMAQDWAGASGPVGGWTAALAGTSEHSVGGRER